MVASGEVLNHVDQLAVTTNMRGKGIGQALMEDICASCHPESDLTAWVLNQREDSFALV